MTVPTQPAPILPSHDGASAPACRFDDLSRAARTVWAKSGDPVGHGLLAHMLDVAAVAERLLLREPASTLVWAACNLGIGLAGAARAIAALVGLHDIGKALPGFQNKWPAGRVADQAAGLPFPARLLEAGQYDQHDRASGRILPSLLAKYLGDLPRARLFASAVAAHHGFVFDQSKLVAAIGAREPVWPEIREEIFAAYWNTLEPQASGTVQPGAEVLTWLAGLTSVADWIGSNTDWFPPAERHAELTGHHAAALTLAEAALEAIRWPMHSPLRAIPIVDLLSALTGQIDIIARPLQAVGATLLSKVREPALMIVEAPMGEGKTELAFLAHLHLQQALGHRGLYIGLPTQATGNAMFDRTVAFLKVAGHDLPLDIQLAHGGAILQDERVVPLRDVNFRREDSLGSSAWFAQRRRPLLSPYGVGTIDQVLLASLNVQHHFVRLWGLTNRVVVLDEVHAYDTYTGTLIEGLLRWLKGLRCSVILMSATLPTAKRDALVAAWSGQTVEVPTLAYPRLIVATGDHVDGNSFESRPQPPIELEALGESLEEITHASEALVRQGGCGAVIVNTVDRAQRLYTMLKQRLSGILTPILFHARFPGEERIARERLVLATFGRAAQRPESALLIATQVVEQSLDIDFDWLLTDLAPIDLLLQRAGRLHRHDRQRPRAHATPRLTVAGGLAQRAPDMTTTAWSALYDEWVLLRSWVMVSRESLWRLPHDIDRLVQAVYGSDDLPYAAPSTVVERIDRVAWGRHLAERGHELQLARNAALDCRQEYFDVYLGKPQGSDEGDFPGVRNVTRLGPESAVVVPVHVEGSRWRPHSNEGQFDPNAPLDSEMARHLVRQQVRISQGTAMKKLNEIELPTAFAEHPWLKHCVPLPLRDNQWAADDLIVRLDPELGIVYSKREVATHG